MSQLKVSELKARCRQLNIKGYSRLNKAELIKLVFPEVLGECCVCYNTRPLRKTTCNHEFCSECWDKWFVIARKVNCPYCRAICIQRPVQQANIELDNNEVEELQIQQLLMNYFRTN